MRIINIEWSGPHTIGEVAKTCHSDTDFGIYQVYGPHPTYGGPQLLYIGKASDRHFSIRIPEHGWAHATRDQSQVSIYLGRLVGSETPDNDTWCEEIALAESLLIYTHFPPYNTQKWAAESDPSIRNVHVLNRGQHRDLLPEVSGQRWFIAPTVFHPYSNKEMKKPAEKTQ